jgi:RNA polymerase sigma-70 factor (ECF subfamily)
MVGAAEGSTYPTNPSSTRSSPLSTESFDHLMGRIRQEDPLAEAAVFDRFVQRLAALVRSRLSAPMRQKLDPQDVTQSAFRSFFRRAKKDEFQLGGWDNLWSVLAQLTLRKCGHQVEHFHAACRDIRREVPTGDLSQDSNASWLKIARDPTPAEAGILTEAVEQILAKLKERERPILLLGLQGHSIPEISTRVGRSRRTVYRVLEYVRKQLETLRDENEHLSAE